MAQASPSQNSTDGPSGDTWTGMFAKMLPASFNPQPVAPPSNASACPVDHSAPKTEEACPVDHSSSSDAAASGCPVDHSSSSDAAASGCPVDHTTAADPNAMNPMTMMPHLPQEMMPDQTQELSTERSISTIPKGDITPAHQSKEVDKWIYPSEQQYYTAMRKKGWSPMEQDIPATLAIHNVVNEKGWTEVLRWEKDRDPEVNPKLRRFMGRPKDLTPKAIIKIGMGYAAPFDRHDWFVDRGDGEEVRYVIDFYSGKMDANAPASIHLDVRPAMDDFTSTSHRLQGAVGRMYERMKMRYG